MNGIDEEAQKAASDDVGRKTYRHIRVAMIVAVFALAISVAYEYLTTGDSRSELCFQGSISAYYWTPVHSVFSGALICIGLCMIVLTTYGPYENMFLNLAGMMAPLVALIPPSRPGPSCKPTRVIELSVGFDIANNAFAFFAGGAGAICTTLLIVARAHPGPVTDFAKRRAGRIQLAVMACVLFALAIWHFAIKNGFQSFAHPISAILMFAFIFVVVVINAQKSTTTPKFRPRYAAVQWFMVGSVVVFVGTKLISSAFDHPWAHYILLIEISMIVAFAAFWILQTTELWNAKPGLPAPAVDAPVAPDAVDGAPAIAPPNSG
jgi:hypothetical protein